MSPAEQLPLRDIHLPDAVSWWPPAPGWWVLVVLGLLAAARLALRYRALRPRRLALRQASAEFEAIRLRYRAGGDGARLTAELSVLLRRVSLSLRPREQVAGLTGRAWLAELDRGLGGNGFRSGPGRILADAPYRPGPPRRNPEMLMELCEHWLGAQRRRMRVRDA